MSKLIHHIVTLSFTLIVGIICALLYTWTPSTFVNATQWNWPSQPERITSPIKPSDAYSSLDLVQAEGVELIQRHCLGCHSDQLIVQNRMSKSRWEDNIKWMQETQGLWDLGPDHDGVINYLAEHYAPLAMGRRPNLDQASIEWYRLNNN